MRGNQITRQWAIIRLLEGCTRGLSVAEIASHLEAGVRTVYRDIDHLQAAGFPLYSDTGDGAQRWKLMDGSKSSLPLPLTMTELMSLHMSRDILKVFEGTVFQESIESLFDKVTLNLPAQTLQYLDNISGRLGIGFGAAKDFSAFRDTIAQLSEATARRTCVEISYKALSTGTKTRRVVEPYQVWAMNGSFYLIGNCRLREEVRTFAMDRIMKLTVLKERFSMPEDFSLDEYLKSAFRVMTGKPETVRVWFRQSAAQVVKERIWHPTQEMREEGDGSLSITLEVPINYEIVSWILGFGSAAEVLSPASLKERIVHELDAARARYGQEFQS
ncbi:MAG: transcriptional regulator [Desulfomonilaceae bacterium]|nr:transcriptional regulator [Desulfomonilaceae bacterium]